MLIDLEAFCFHLQVEISLYLPDKNDGDVGVLLVGILIADGPPPPVGESASYENSLGPKMEPPFSIMSLQQVRHSAGQVGILAVPQLISRSENLSSYTFS